VKWPGAQGAIESRRGGLKRVKASHHSWAWRITTGPCKCGNSNLERISGNDRHAGQCWEAGAGARFSPTARQ